jgi:hypothetical protein
VAARNRIAVSDTVRLTVGSVLRLVFLFLARMLNHRQKTRAKVEAVETFKFTEPLYKSVSVLV